jgi:hypothetical protein
MELKVEGRPDLIRDMSTQAIINTNSSKAEKAKKLRDEARRKDYEFEKMKDELSELKAMLKQLLEK